MWGAAHCARVPWRRCLQKRSGCTDVHPIYSLLLDDFFVGCWVSSLGVAHFRICNP